MVCMLCYASIKLSAQISTVNNQTTKVHYRKRISKILFNQQRVRMCATVGLKPNTKSDCSIKVF